MRVLTTAITEFDGSHSARYYVDKQRLSPWPTKLSDCDPRDENCVAS